MGVEGLISGVSRVGLRRLVLALGCESLDGVEVESSLRWNVETNMHI